jgi:hypothetical protein
MKFLLVVLMLVLPVHFLHAADPVFPQGSMIGLVPPQGMTPATTFSGFQDEAGGASIILSTIPGITLRELIAELSDGSKLAQQGIIEDRRENLTVGGNPALLIIGRQQLGTESVRKWMIIMGSPEGVAFVTAQYRDAAAIKYPDAVIRAALTSIVFRDAPTRSEQAAALPFTIPALGRFRIIAMLGGYGIALTDGPKDADPEYEQASFIAALTDVVPAVAERDAFARGQFLASRAIHITGIESADFIEVKGLPAHEIIGSAQTRSGVPLKVVQWTLFAPNSTLLQSGTTRPPQFEQVYLEFLALRDGIHPK